PIFPHLPPPHLFPYTTLFRSVTVALCSIRLTAASCTPGWLASVRCTKDWHAAQVMPVTGTVIRAGDATEAGAPALSAPSNFETRSEEHTSELQSRSDLVCRLL